MSSECNSDKCIFVKAMKITVPVLIALFVLVYTGYFTLDKKIDNITSILLTKSKLGGK